jgi:C-terminal domain 10 of the ABC-three component (ABC-3C) systems
MPIDRISRVFFEQEFKIRFLEKKGNAFQDFFADVMEKRYPGDFIRVRPWGKSGDRKNDGYLRSKRTLFQVYAPNEMSASKCIAKIEEDFFGALPHWGEYFNKWRFAHNSKMGIGPEVTEKLLELDNKYPDIEVRQFGFEELRNEVFHLPELELSLLFGPAPSVRSMTELGLEDLEPVIIQISKGSPTREPDLRPVPKDKVDQNALSEDVEILIKAGMSRADLVRKYCRAQPTLQDKIAEGFRKEYRQLSGEGLAPDEIFSRLQRFAGGDRVTSPTRQSAILAVLAFFFEECDIFEDVEKEPLR